MIVNLLNRLRELEQRVAVLEKALQREKPPQEQAPRRRAKRKRG